MTLSAFVSPLGLAALLAWSFLVLAAVQLTIRLIMAFSVRATLLGAAVLTILNLPIAALYDLLAGPAAPFDTRLTWLPLAMALNGLAGFATARRVLRFKRVRGQVLAAAMIGVLGWHYLVPSLIALV